MKKLSVCVALLGTLVSFAAEPEEYEIFKQRVAFYLRELTVSEIGAH